MFYPVRSEGSQFHLESQFRIFQNHKLFCYHFKLGTRQSIISQYETRCWSFIFFVPPSSHCVANKISVNIYFYLHISKCHESTGDSAGKNQSTPIFRMYDATRFRYISLILVFSLLLFVEFNYVSRKVFIQRFAPPNPLCFLGIGSFFRYET